MNNQDLKINKTERFKQFVGVCLQEDIDSLRGFPLRETSLNLGIAVLMILMAALHLLHSALQFAFSLVAVASDLLVRGLVKIMPAPKQPKEPAKEQP